MPTINSPFSPRRGSKKVLRFSLMVAGQSGLGKTTFLRTFFGDNISAPVEKFEGIEMEFPKSTDSITSYTFEMESNDGVRMLVEAIDTPGFDDDNLPEDRAKELLNFIEGTYDEVFAEEQRIHRIPKFEEHRIHALAYFIEPTGLGLKKSDAEFMKLLSSRINIIPVIAKADALTPSEMAEFKEKINTQIYEHNITVFDFEKLESTENAGDQVPMPLSVIGSTFPAKGRLGRAYPWGFVDVSDSNSCDFNLLKLNILELFRDDLKETTEDGLYEKYRTEKLLKISQQAVQN